jgi:hypothetical protein
MARTRNQTAKEITRPKKEKKETYGRGGWLKRKTKNQGIKDELKHTILLEELAGAKKSTERPGWEWRTQKIRAENAKQGPNK